MDSTMFLNWIKDLCVKASQVGSWLTTPFFNQYVPGWGQITLTPLVLVSVGGLLSFIVIAFAKWISS